MPAKEQVVLEAAGREVRLSSPGRVVFPERGFTKLDIARYYLDVADAVLGGLRDRPSVLRRYPDGAAGAGFFQKRVPAGAPPWLDTEVVTFTRGGTAEELVVQDAAHLVWAVNLGVIDFNPWPVRRPDLEHPDELRIDLDPADDVGFPEVRRVALLARELLAEHGLVGWPKTSGSRGIHILVRLHPERGFDDVRRAAIAFARAVERRAPAGLATTEWWKDERRGVFIDFNQNARDRTLASAWSLRPKPDARVSFPLRWDEVADVEPADFRLDTAPALLRERGDAHAGSDGAPGRLDSLLELADRDTAAGVADPPSPSQFRNQAGRGRPGRAAPARTTNDEEDT